MIHHLSMSARDPQHVAAVLAELIGGAAVPFPPNPGSWFALQRDEHGTGVEIYPAGTELRPEGADGTGFAMTDAPDPGFGPTHFAMSVETTPETITDIARREGWQCELCARGGPSGFRVMEVWIDNKFMIELLPPAFATEYLALHRALRQFMAPATAEAAA